MPANPAKEEGLDLRNVANEYVLPDGNLISVGKARFRAPEVLFDPSLIGEEADGVHKVLTYAIRKSDMDLRKKLYQNMVLSGGSTLFKVRTTVPAPKSWHCTHNVIVGVSHKQHNHNATSHSVTRHRIVMTLTAP